MSVIETSGLSKYYGNILALDGVDLEVRDGEMLGFIGPNGAGKSTTIRILLGLVRRSGGYARVFGLDTWADAVEIHRGLAYVPEEVRLWPNLTGGEVIDLFSTLRGSRASGRRTELLERFDLDPTKKCGTYSKGNRQKVALVSALVSDVDLYILDEPTSGLDPLMASVFQDCVGELRQAGKTILMSSHILADVEKLCDRVSIIRQGQIVESGTLTDLRHLTSSVVRVETEQPITGLEGFPGVHDLRATGNRAEMQVEGDSLNGLMSHLTGLGIRSLTTTPPTLEELFMRHYSDEPGRPQEAEGVRAR